MAWRKIDGIGGDTIENITNNTETNDIDITYTDKDGNKQDTSLMKIKRKFNWLYDVADIGRMFVNRVSAYESSAHNYTASVSGSSHNGVISAPSIPLPLSKAQSHFGYVYGEDMEFLDLSWYTPYKSTVDGIVSGFLWLLFLWGLFKNAPSIVSGIAIGNNSVEGITGYYTLLNNPPPVSSLTSSQQRRSKRR